MTALQNGIFQISVSFELFSKTRRVFSVTNYKVILSKYVRFKKESFGTAIYLTGRPRHFTIEPQGSNECFKDPETCNDGFTLQFKIKFYGLYNRGVVMTNGGDDVSSYGIAMVYKLRRLFVSSSI